MPARQEDRCMSHPLFLHCNDNSLHLTVYSDQANKRVSGIRAHSSLIDWYQTNSIQKPCHIWSHSSLVITALAALLAVATCQGLSRRVSLVVEAAHVLRAAIKAGTSK